MPLSERKNKQILAIIDNLLSHHSSVYFDHPVDPEIDQAPTYFSVVKNPMDLGTIRSKIERNEYDSISSFISDVELVWSNAILFNGKSSFMFYIVRYLQNIFKEQIEFLSDDTRKDWIMQMNDLRSKLGNIISNPPTLISQEMGSSLKSHYSAASIASSASTTTFVSETSTSILASYSTTNLTTHTKSHSSRNRRKFNSAFSDDEGDDADNSIPNKVEKPYYGFDVDDGSDDDEDGSRWNKKSHSSKKSNKKSQSKSNSSQKKNTSNKKSSSNTFVAVEPDLTEDEIEKLANDVNQLAADDDKNTEIANLLQSMEPQLSFDEEVGVEKLSMPTLKSLKKLVNKLMNS